MGMGGFIDGREREREREIWIHACTRGMGGLLVIIHDSIYG
jgi:hypothetical protein